MGFRLGIAAVILAGCGMPEPTVMPPTYGLVIVNDSGDPVFWSIEQPTGQLSRFTVEPCSSTSHSIELGRAWEVEWGATFAVTSDDVGLLDAPVTVINVRFDADGGVDVANPQPAARQPDAPSDEFTCVVR